jgi:hypothetical protein
MTSWFRTIDQTVQRFRVQQRRHRPLNRESIRARRRTSRPLIPKGVKCRNSPAIATLHDAWDEGWIAWKYLINRYCHFFVDWLFQRKVCWYNANSTQRAANAGETTAEQKNFRGFVIRICQVSEEDGFGTYQPTYFQIFKKKLTAEDQQMRPSLPASEWPGGFSPTQRSSAGWLAGWKRVSVENRTLSDWLSSEP